ncbi:MAG: Gfo/Idh/MocA family oxidoreductase [Armatimonadota bacterium]|nr:Gfo/Idh/MocA family oxidoreductase [Armatimonadota bacterium]
MSFTLGVYIHDNPHTDGHMRDVEALAAVDRVLMAGSERAAQIAAQMYKADFVGGWDDLMAEDDVQAVMVLTNNRDAGRMTLEAIEAGRSVYGEKPGARTVADMEAIVEAAERTGAHFTPCYVRRTFAETRELRRLLSEGAVGELWSFQANWITSQAQIRGVEHWLFDREVAGGGILYWLGCHWLDTLRFVTDQRVVAVCAMTATQDDRIGVEDVACLSVRLEGGALGTIRCGYLLNPWDDYDDYQLMTAWEGSLGSLSHFPKGPVTLRLRTRAGHDAPGGELWETRIDDRRPAGYAYYLLADVVEAASEGREPMVTERDALYVMRVIEAAYEAARTGAEQTVEWD